MAEHRIPIIREISAEHRCQAFLTTRKALIRWACGFTGSNGLLLVTSTDAFFLTDSRYTVQSSDEISGARIVIQGGSLAAGLAHNGMLDGIDRVLVDPEDVTLQQFTVLKRIAPAVDWVPVSKPLRERIAEKEEVEVSAIRAAQRLTDSVFEGILGVIRPGLSEREIAADIIHLILKGGADSVSFPPIVASGPNGALPHASPSQRRLERGDLVVLDFGCIVDGYASDMTRTVAIGEPGPKARQVYSIVSEALEAAIAAARSGMAARELDAVARRVIRSHGFASAFVHSLGHGVGTDVHEWPRISFSSEDILPDGCVVTLEPGIYLEGELGIRIEDMVLLHRNGCDVLTGSTKKLVVL